MTFAHAFQKPPQLVQTTTSAGSRCYKVPNTEKHYESVTTFLGRLWNKGAIRAWEKRLGKEEAEKERMRAAVRGKKLHALSESYLKNEEVNYQNDPMSKVLFVKIKPLLDRIDNIRFIETPIYSDKLALAGTPDIIADYDSDLAVIDLKTATKVKKKKWIINYFLQVGCYGVMYEELYGVLPKKAVIIVASESLNQPQIFVEDMEICVKMLTRFIIDPVKFQVKAGNK